MTEICEQEIGSNSPYRQMICPRTQVVTVGANFELPTPPYFTAGSADEDPVVLLELGMPECIENKAGINL